MNLHVRQIDGQIAVR